MNHIRYLLALLAAFFTLGPDPGDGDGDDPPAGDPPGDDPPGDLDLDGDGDPDPDAGRRDNPDGDDPATLRARAERAERERDEAREAARRQADSQRQPPPGQLSREQLLHQQEEEELRDPKLDAGRRWQIESNRVLRQNTQTSQAALHEARELSDRTEFNTYCKDNAIGKKYSSRVEEKLAEIRKGGGNLQRMVVLRMLVGDDVVSGKIGKSKKQADGDPPVSRVHRGTPPVSRSDVRGRGGQSEREKRRARLDGQNI